MLEVIDKGSSSQTHPVPLLFLHGGWHGAWSWDDHFLDYFAGAGYRSVAVSLPGHGSDRAGGRPLKNQEPPRCSSRWFGSPRAQHKT
jgi:pimeloyl-ACP methyl ester carboxylesterase